MKRPSFQFYPGDWLNDSKLNLCGPATHGVWMELLCHMHQSDRRGFLSFGDRKLTRSDILKLSKFSPKVVRKAIDELTTFGILLEDEKFGFYSKRMVKDERLSALREEAGKLGGNPNLVNQNSSKMEKNGKQKPTPSSSSSTSSSININTPLPPKGGESDFYKFFQEYPEHRRGNEDAARKLWQKNGLDARSAQVIESLSSWKKSQEWKKDDKRFVPSLSNFLRGERWKVLPGDVKPPIKQKENPYITAWKSGKRFFHQGADKTYQAGELVLVNWRAKNETARPLNGFRLPNGLHLPFEDFIYEE